ncbi:MAG: hypothetical protein EZS28_018481, partial [Streblomastix strix]
GLDLKKPLAGRLGNDIRKIIIKAGVIESFNFIFENREMKQITRTYSLTVYSIINNSSDEVRFLIYSKNPYYGLIRLLEHTDVEIASDAIGSIFNIIKAGSNTIPYTEPHPHYDSIQALDGINKIFSLFQKNGNKYSKDRAAICIGCLFRAHEITDPVMRLEIFNHLKSLLSDSEARVKERAKDALKQLAQNEVNRSEFLNEKELSQIEQDLKQPIEGTEEQKKSILQKQESDLLLLQSVLQDRDDNELRKRIISSDVIESLLFIYTNRDLNSITRTYSLTFIYLTNNSSDEIKLLLLEKKPYPGLVRLLEHTDDSIASYAIISIFLLLESGSNSTPEADPHPHYDSIQALDGINKIYALFQKNGSKYSKDRAAICIGCLFRAHEITDPVMRLEIINHLKCLLNDSDKLVKYSARNALYYLAQNDTIRSEIIKR